MRTHEVVDGRPNFWPAKETIFPPRFGYLVERFLKHGTKGPEEIPL